MFENHGLCAYGAGLIFEALAPSQTEKHIDTSRFRVQASGSCVAATMAAPHGRHPKP